MNTRGTYVIDFHSHMLPDMDDGSPDVRTSMAMLQMAREQGVQIQLLTPHYYPWREDIASFSRRRAERFKEFRAQLPPDAPQLLCGAETAFFYHMSERDLSPLCVDGSRVLLIELPFERWENRVIDEIATLSLDQGFQVVLAHVERFLRYRGNAEQLRHLSALPLHMQINAESFQKFFTRKQALALVHSGQASILGSDAHNLTDRKPNLSIGRDWIQKRLGDAVLQRMDQAASSLLHRIISDASAVQDTAASVPPLEESPP